MEKIKYIIVNSCSEGSSAIIQKLTKEEVSFLENIKSKLDYVSVGVCNYAPSLKLIPYEQLREEIEVQYDLDSVYENYLNIEDYFSNEYYQFDLN